MTKKREGWHNVSLQFPDVVWDALVADADERGVTITMALAEVLRKVYRIPREKMPALRRAGRKPKS